MFAPAPGGWPGNRTSPGLMPVRNGTTVGLPNRAATGRKNSGAVSGRPGNEIRFDAAKRTAGDGGVARTKNRPGSPELVTL